jgi:hypothetical protein
MPRYLFHIVDEKSRPNGVRDGEGTVLRDATEARKEAVGLARDIAKHGLDGSTKWKIVVTDEHGENILIVPLAEVYTFRARAWFAVRGFFSKLVYRTPRALAWSMAAGVIGVQTIALAMLLQEPKPSSCGAETGCNDAGSCSCSRRYMVFCAPFYMC